MRQDPQAISSLKLRRAFASHPAQSMPRTRAHITDILVTESAALADCTSAQIAAVVRLIHRAYHEGRHAPADQ